MTDADGDLSAWVERKWKQGWSFLRVERDGIEVAWIGVVDGRRVWSAEKTGA